MKRYTLILATLLPLLIPMKSWGGDIKKGMDAYSTGDYATAFKEWLPLAEQGINEFQYSLGYMYSSGQGVPQDYQTSAKWYTLSAEQGNADAQYNLGVMYGNGQGVPQDYKIAVKWYTLAAEQGQVNAQNNLGYRYEVGKGIQKNYFYAHMWYNISASNGYDLGDENLAIIAKKMTPSQIEEAQKLARECVAKNYKGC